MTTLEENEIQAMDIEEAFNCLNQELEREDLEKKDKKNIEETLEKAVSGIDLHFSLFKVFHGDIQSRPKANFVHVMGGGDTQL